MSRFLDMYMANHAPIAPTPTTSTNNSIDNATESSSLLAGTNGVGNQRTDTDVMPVTWNLVFSMVFLEAIGLYSLIVALFMSSA